MKRQNPTYRRTSKMDRPAFKSDLERLTHAPLPHSTCHPWAKKILDDLDRDELKVFSFMLSLARCGRKGYPGLAEPDIVAADTVRKITGQKCGLSTWRNGRRKLCARGILSRTFWTRPDQQIRNGNRTVIVKGGARVHKGDDKWCTKQIRVTLLTPAGAALFDRATRLESREILSLFLTPLKNNANPRIEDSKEPSNEGLLACPKATSTDDVTQRLKSNSPSLSGLEGNPTRPSSSSSSSSSTVEHSPSTSEPAILSHQTKPQPDPKEALNKASRFEFGPSWTGSRGCTAKRPTIPKGSENRKGRSFARLRLLNVLHHCLWNYPTPEADDIYSRARSEFEMSDFSNWPTLINLPYWLSRSPKLTRRELFGYMRARILPALKYSAPVVPNERKRYREWTEPDDIAGAANFDREQLPEWLRDAYDRQAPPGLVQYQSTARPLGLERGAVAPPKPRPFESGSFDNTHPPCDNKSISNAQREAMEKELGSDLEILEAARHRAKERKK